MPPLDHERDPGPRRALPASFESRTVVIDPGGSLHYVESQWRDAIVSVQRGTIELECRFGSRRRFHRGDLLWLIDLDIRVVHNCTDEPVELVAISRRPR